MRLPYHLSQGEEGICVIRCGPSMMPNAFLRWRESNPDNGVHIAGREGGKHIRCGGIAFGLQCNVFSLISGGKVALTAPGRFRGLTQPFPLILCEKCYTSATVLP